MPWLTGVVVQKVIHGVGWRWGYGMFVLIMPAGACGLILSLFYLQRKARLAGYSDRKKMTIPELCSQMDLGGLCLVCGGFTLLLLPIALASKTSISWSRPWVPLLAVLGSIALACVLPYERKRARYPVIPERYFYNRTIVAALVLFLFEKMGHSATHVYIFPWSIIAHNFTPQRAIYLSYVNSMAEAVTGFVTGAVMYRLRAFKHITIAGSMVRMGGYALMTRLRRNDSTVAELFLAQIIQGIGGGMLESTTFLAAQIVVPQAELAQVTALLSTIIHVGLGVGAALAGAVYTTSMKSQLRQELGSAAPAQMIEDLYNSIDTNVPAWGSAERQAAGRAYSNVMGSITFIALATTVPALLCAFLLPNHRLGDGKNLVVAPSDGGESVDHIPLRRAKRKRRA